MNSVSLIIRGNLNLSTSYWMSYDSLCFLSNWSLLSMLSNLFSISLSV